MDISPYLKLMIEKEASDLFISTESAVLVKIDGQIHPVGKTILDADATLATAHGIMNERQKDIFESELEVDFAIESHGARFRVNVFTQRGATALVLRYIKAQIPTIDELNLPNILRELVLNKRGMILVVGATGSGKSTSLAAMLNHRNETKGGHILTIEDPIEFVHPNKKSLFNQREVGVDTLSYANALKSSLREAPDVILVGEVREQHTMEALIELAGTGHLAISTLHANNAHQTLDRIINMFSEEQQKLLLMDLSVNLRAIISQRLVRTKDGKRAAAVEIMINTPHIAELIREAKINEISEAMDGSSVEGMQTYDEALLELYKSGQIDLEEALANADSRTNLEAKINFG